MHPALTTTLATVSLLASTAAQLGQRVSPVIDVGAIVRANPLFGATTIVDFACRAADGSWWVGADGYLLRMTPTFQTLGAVATSTSHLLYEPSTDRIYRARPVSGQFYGCLSGCGAPYIYVERSFALDYLQLDGTATFTTQATAPFPPFSPASPFPLPNPRSPRRIGSDGSGGVIVWTDNGHFSLDVASGSLTSTSLTEPSGVFATLPGTNSALVATAGSCISGPASSCLRMIDLTTGQPTSHSFPVDLSPPGPGASRGGQVRAISFIPDAGAWRALLLTSTTSTTLAYALDVTSPAAWPGCGGTMTLGPIIELNAIAVDAILPGAASWLIVSPGYLNSTIPGLLPAGCVTHLDPNGHIALPPVLVPSSGHVAWRITIPTIPGLDNSLLFFQCLTASLTGFAASEARSAVVRQ